MLFDIILKLHHNFMLEWRKKKIATQNCPVKNTTIFKVPMYVAHNEIKDVIEGFNPRKVKLWTKITIGIWPCKY